jgi:hypothetical protein
VGKYQREFQSFTIGEEKILIKREYGLSLRAIKGNLFLAKLTKIGDKVYLFNKKID